jgi:hypothetical protein
MILLLVVPVCKNCWKPWIGSDQKVSLVIFWVTIHWIVFSPRSGYRHPVMGFYLSVSHELQTIEQRIVSLDHQKALLRRSALNCLLDGSESKRLSPMISHHKTRRAGGHESVPIRLLTSSTFERCTLWEYPPRQWSTRFGNVSTSHQQIFRHLWWYLQWSNLLHVEGNVNTQD